MCLPVLQKSSGCTMLESSTTQLGALNPNQMRADYCVDVRCILPRTDHCVLCTNKRGSVATAPFLHWVLISKQWSWSSPDLDLQKSGSDQIRVMIVNKQIARAPLNATSITSDKILLSSAGWSTLYCEIRGRDTLLPSMSGNSWGKQCAAAQKS